MLELCAYAAVAGGLFVALWKHPAVALAGVLCMFGLEQWGQASHHFFLQNPAFTNVLIGGILVLALISKVLKGESLFENYPATGWLVLALFSYACVSAIWAPRPDLSFDVWSGRAPYVLTLIVLAPLVISQSSDLQVSFKTLILVGSFLIILLLAFVSWDSRLIVLGEGRGNPLAVSSMAGMVALVAILVDVWPSSKLWKLLRWVVVILCMILIVRSGSRGQLLGAIAVAVMCWPLSRKGTSLKHFLSLLCLVLFLGGITSFALEEFWAEKSSYFAGGSRWSEEAMAGAMVGRFEQGLYIVGLWLDSPETIFFGLGNSASYDPRILGIYPHFVPLEILAEEGVIGASLFLMILYVTARSALRCYRFVYLDPKERSIFAGLLALFLYTFLLSLKQGSLLGNLEPFMFAIMLGKQAKLYEGHNFQEHSVESKC